MLAKPLTGKQLGIVLGAIVVLRFAYVIWTQGVSHGTTLPAPLPAGYDVSVDTRPLGLNKGR